MMSPSPIYVVIMSYYILWTLKTARDEGNIEGEAER